MNQSNSSSWQRYEIKYLVDDSVASKARAICRSHLPLDPFSAIQDNASYPILSIYLDSNGGALYRSTIDRRVDRLKLRARSYRHHAEHDEGPLFLEIKRKVHGVIHKTRAKRKAQDSARLVWGDPNILETEGLDSQTLEPETLKNTNLFLATRSKVDARPNVGVFYYREAYQSPGSDGVRITLDTELHYGLLTGQEEISWWPVSMGGTILEIKFTTTYPDWLAHMIRSLDLVRTGACKYAMCFEAAYGRPSINVFR